MSAAAQATTLLAQLGVGADDLAGGDLVVRTPITGEEIARVARTDAAATDAAIARATDAFAAWRDLPGPHRGELVRLLGEELRREKDALARSSRSRSGRSRRRGSARCRR